MNPIFSKQGGYPQVMVDEIGNKSKAEDRPWSRLPSFTEAERESLVGSSDFLAFNYYTSRLVAPLSVIPSETSFDNDVGVEYSVDNSWTKGKSPWLYSVPKGLEDILKWIKEKYNNPTVLITENGTSDEGTIDDVYRIEYLKSHLAAVARAIEQGCNVIGYTVWSIVDNFEWTKGYTEHFGIFSVDMTSSEKERKPKASAKFMKELIESKTLVF
jgi:beta-glucosidase/6-phospho-beta-glucosidase/beta-galactosidase